MKVFGIDDNSEAFSLLVTAICGVLLFTFAWALHRHVIPPKVVQNVNSQDKSSISSKQLFSGISKEAAKDISKLN